MIIATWNVNSIRVRINRVLDFLERKNVDVLALQETKCKNSQFPTEPFQNAGYQLVTHGFDQWNGVAILSRLPILHSATQFPGQPVWQKNIVEARAISATVETNAATPTTFWSVYAPNGRELDHPHYQYKLEWLDALKHYADDQLRSDPSLQMTLMGDWNIAPQNEDVWDIEHFDGSTHVSTLERASFHAFAEKGFVEVTRNHVTNFTYWDYQRLRFPKNQGMRIDFIYATPAFASTVIGAQIDRNERKGKGASDHVPVIVETQDPTNL